MTPPRPSRPTVRVVLADDDPGFRAAAQAALEAGPEVLVVASLPHGGDVPAALTAERADVLVMDAQMPFGGADLVRQARRQGVQVMVTTAADDLDSCLELLHAGATCLVSKHGLEVDLNHCAVRCHRGDVLLIGACATTLLDLLLNP